MTGCFRERGASDIEGLFAGMPTNLTPADPGGGPANEQDYVAYKRAKIERGLEQSRDRSAMIPIEQVWRDLSR